MTAIGQALSSALLHFVWQGMVVAIVLWIALFLLRNRSANARYLTCCGALAILVLAPLVTAVALYRSPAPDVGVLQPHDQVTTGSVAAKPAARMPIDWIATLQPWALPVWSFGVLLCSMRLVWGCRQIAVLRRRGAAADESVRALVAVLAGRMRVSRAVRVLIAPESESPSVIGWLRPAILLPAATLLHLTPEQLEAILAHELAHIRRHDYLVNLLQIAAETLLFYHPAVWWTSARMRHEREFCCDDLAVSCCDKLSYARALTRLERLRVTAPAMAMGSTGGSMLFRIQRLLGAGANDYAPSKLLGIAALALGIGCLVLTTHHARAQQPANVGVAFDVTAPEDGPGIKVDLQGSSLLHRTAVEYPGSAWERRIEGTVLVEATTDSSGAVNDARILAGPSELRKAALQSVLQWHFAPDASGAAKHISISFQHVERKNRPEGVGRTLVLTTPQNPDEQKLRREIEMLEKQVVESRQAAGAPVSTAEADQIKAAKQKYETLLRQLEAERANGSEPAQQAVQEQVAQIQEQLTEFERAREAGSVNAASEQNKEEREKIELLEHRLNELKERSQQERTFVFNEPTAELAGRRLEQIDISGLSPQQQSELSARLPVRLGDTLTAESIESLNQAVNQFDQHLEANLGLTETGGVSARIFLRGGFIGKRK